MDDMEEKLGAILGNPQMMQQIMSMAQSMGAQQPQKEEAPQKRASILTHKKGKGFEEIQNPGFSFRI